MTIEKLLQKYQSNQSDDANDHDVVEDQGAYGIFRAPRERALMLELRKKDSTVLAIPYALIEQITFSPADGITLYTCGHEIRITGRNLNSATGPKIGLLNGLCRHRIAWIQEYSRAAAAEPNTTATQIDAITL